MRRVTHVVPSSLRTSRRNLATRLSIIVSVLLLGACDIRYRVFEPVNPAPLEEQLVVGEAKRADVRATLGEPTGSGRAMLPLDLRPRTLWSYFFEEGSLESAGRTMVLVYFDEEALAGYIWFSSEPNKITAP